MQDLTAGDSLVALTLVFAISAPLLSFAVNLLITSRYSWVSSLISTLLLLLSLVLTLVLLFKASPEKEYLFQIHWFSAGAYKFSTGVLLNRLSLLMLITVGIISFLVHVYSAGFMATDRGLQRYFAFLGLFTFSMQGLVLSADLLTLFAFWELVGFCSYILIGHWIYKPVAAAAARKAFLFNRIGDAGLLAGLMVLLYYANTLELQALVSVSLPAGMLTWISLLLFVGVIGKSAQFPLFTWLPDAMAGPTPVSALIHAATMVAAGVFLLARVSFLFTPTTLIIVAAIGAITGIIGSLLALGQFDLKKILAYSTISQLGLMVLATGTGLSDASIFHLLTHAMFKACLFLAAGALVYSIEEGQHQANIEFDAWDIRNLGGLLRKMPLTFSCFLVSGLSLAGIPFTTGFLSKEAILNGVINWSLDGPWWRWLFSSAALAISLITVLYVFRLLWYVFTGTPRKATLQLREAPVVMRLPMVLLALLSLFPAVSTNPFSSKGWIFQSEPHSFAVYTYALILFALIIGYLLFVRTKSKRVPFDLIVASTIADRVYGATFGKSVTVLARSTEFIDRKILDTFLHSVAITGVVIAHLTAWFDRHVLDGILVKGPATIVGGIGQVTRSFQSGRIQRYIFWSILGIIILLVVILV